MKRTGLFVARPIPEGHSRLLARCPEKRCEYCKAFDFIPGDGVIMRVHNEARCPSHPRARLTVEIVKGTYSEGRKCDPRCAYALGPICNCACAGANHGGGWL